MGFLDTLFGGGAEKDAANQNRTLLSDYLGKGTTALDNAYGTSTGALNKAYGSLSDLAGKYGQGTDLYLNALGVNGADAAKTAQSSFTNNPGYDAAVTAGLDAINRRRAAGGMLDSGNADLDALTFGQNLQNQQYGGWLDRLSGLVSPELSATTAGAGVQQSLSDLAQTDATNRIGLYGNYTSGNMSANNAEAAGKAQGAKNLLGGALSLAQLGLTAGGVGGFGSGGLSSMKVGNQTFPMYR
ncbi:MAG: hypothetical protein J0G95_10820 [Rhizobiales bacterium]|nr:hypothetical protein [Hyphomicrobiales bacterium]